MRLKSSLAAVVLLSLLLCSCASSRLVGSPGAESLPSSAPVCLSRSEYVRVRLALSHLKDRLSDCKADAMASRERDRIVHQRVLQSRALALLQCRQERDAALGRKCPLCKSSPVWPVAVAAIVGVVVGVGGGIVIGIAIR